MNDSTTLQALAADCLRQAEGDRQRAAELLYQRLNEDQKAQLLDRYLDKAIWSLLKSAVQGAVPDLPAQSANRVAPFVAADSAAGLFRLARANLDNLLDGYRLSSGILLGNANRTQLLEEAAREHGQASAHLERCLFLRAVANRIGSAAKVRAVMLNDDLRQLALSATRDVTQ